MKWLCLLGIRFYKRFLTQYTPACPMTPCCSTYAYDAIKKHGARVGLDMAVAYLHNCGKEVST